MMDLLDLIDGLPTKSAKDTALLRAVYQELLSDERSLCKAVDILRNAGNVERAIDVLNKLRKERDLVEDKRLYASLLNQAGKWDEAFEEYASLKDLTCAIEVCVKGYSDHYLKKAENLIERVVASEEDRDHFYLYLYASAGRITQAAQILERRNESEKLFKLYLEAGQYLNALEVAESISKNTGVAEERRLYYAQQVGICKEFAKRFRQLPDTK